MATDAPAFRAPAWPVRPLVDAGAVYAPTRESIRGFSAGEGRALVRRVTGLPDGVALEAVQLTVYAAASATATGAKLFTKLALAEDPANDAEGGTLAFPAGAAPEVTFAFAQTELSQLVSVRGFIAEVLLSDGTAQVVARGTLASDPLAGSLSALSSAPVSIELTTAEPDPPSELPVAITGGAPVARLVASPAALVF